MIKRRAAAQIIASAAAIAALGGSLALPALAAEKVVKVGIALPLTGADSESALRIKNGAVLAFEEANAKHEIPGVKLEMVVLDSGTATAGQYDPAQAATNARKFASDKGVVGIVGPEMSGEGKAMAPILSQADLAIITPSATNPDITDPKFAAQFRPAGKPIFFRTVTTDAFQGPNMANYYADTLKVKSVYVLDDSGAYGVGIADAFQAQAEKKGIKVLGRDRLDPKEADYSAILTKIKSLNPDAIYYGGVTQAGVKLAKQAYDIIPKAIKAGGDGLYAPEMLTAAGFPAAEGWYASNAGPHMTEDKTAAEFMKRYKERFNLAADDYTITAYDAAQVLIDAIRKVEKTGKPITRDAVRDAIAGAKIKTMQGMVSFDANGDIVDRTVSVFQIKQDKSLPQDDVNAQFKYVGVAPQS